MLGHVTLSALVAEHAASHSPAIIDGLLITDDLNMGAVYSKGIGSVAGEALAAGVDLVLVSYDPRQVYRALAGAAEALSEHRIAPARLAESDRRLADFANQPAPLAPTAMMQESSSPLALVAGHQPICCGQQEKTDKIQICPAPPTPAQFGGMPARL
jgi:beta-glucosidase-like glycosyl hydrolase